MLGLVYLLYGVFLLVYGIMSVFVVYHLRRYMLNHAVASFLVTLFLIVSSILLLINLALFASVPFDQIFSPANGPLTF